MPLRDILTAQGWRNLRRQQLEVNVKALTVKRDSLIAIQTLTEQKLKLEAEILALSQKHVSPKGKDSQPEKGTLFSTEEPGEWSADKADQPEDQESGKDGIERKEVETPKA